MMNETKRGKGILVQDILREDACRPRRFGGETKKGSSPSPTHAAVAPHRAALLANAQTKEAAKSVKKCFI